MVPFNPNLPLSASRPIPVDISMNLDEILKFPIIRNNNGTIFLQDQVTGQVYIIDESRYNALVTVSGTNGTNGTNGTSGIGGAKGIDDCEKQVFWINFDSLRILKGLPHDPPTFDPNLEGLHPDKQNQCELWVDLYRCCYRAVTTRNDVTGTTTTEYVKTREEKVGEIRIARSKQYSEWFEDPNCVKRAIDPITGEEKKDSNGNPILIQGRRLRIRQYLSVDDLKIAFPFVDGYNLKITGAGILQDQIVYGKWNFSCETTYNENNLFDGVDAYRRSATADGSPLMNFINKNTNTRKITRAVIDSGKLITVSDGTPPEEIFEMCGNVDCCFEGECIYEAQPPGPPSFWCVEVDTPKKIDVIKNGGKGYTDKDIETILGSFVPIDLLKRIIQQGGVFKNALTAEEEKELSILMTHSLTDFRDIPAPFKPPKTKAELQALAYRLDELSSRKYKLRIQSDDVKYIVYGQAGNDFLKYYIKVFQDYAPNREPIYTHYLVLDTLEEFLEFSNKYNVLASSIVGSGISNYTEEKTNESRIVIGSERPKTVPGFPCEIQNVADFENKWNLYYTAYKICYRSDGSIFVEPITDGNGNILRFIYKEEWRKDPRRVEEPIPNTRRYDPNSNCCDNAELVHPGGPLPPNYPRTATLEYDLTSAEWISSNPDDPCDCDQYQIADLYCHYDGQRISLRYAKNLKNTLTILKDINTGLPLKRRRPTAECEDDRSWRVYYPLINNKDIIKGKTKHITRGLFNSREHIDCYLTSSKQSAENKKYYYDVVDCDDCDIGPYFALAYGHISGSGSSHLDEYSLDRTPSDAIYSQYQLLGTDNVTKIDRKLPSFTFVSASKSKNTGQIYAINFYRDGMVDKLDPGNFQINLSFLSGSHYANNVHTGSNVKVGSPFVMSLIDDSDQFTEGILCDGGDLIYYNIVSGTLTGGVHEKASINSYGIVYPQLGVVVLDADRLDQILGFNTVTGSNINGDNAFKLFTSISGAATPTDGRTGENEIYHLTARSIKYKATNHFFVRVPSNNINYSNNPTFHKPYIFMDSPTTGQVVGNYIKYNCFINDPEVYITSVGLYNDARELLAIAKISRPVKKNFDKELLIKIRLNW